MTLQTKNTLTIRCPNLTCYQAASKINAFKYLKDGDESSAEYNTIINGIVDFNQSPHKNKKAYSVTFVKDTGCNDYRSRIGFNLYP